MENDLFNEIIHNFDFLILDAKNYVSCIYKKETSPKILMIDYDTKNDCFVFCLNKSIRIIKKSDYLIIKHFISQYSDYTIYYASNECKHLLVKTYPHILFNFTKKDQKHFLNLEIPNFMAHFEIKDMKMKDNWKIIQRCISGFLIKKGYFNSLTNRLQISRKSNQFETEKIIKNPKKFVTLQNIANGSSWNVDIVYNIEEEKVFIDKISNNDDDEQPKLYEREVKNYTALSHPLMSQYFGNYNDNNKNHLIIEYIEGETLKTINYKNFYEEEIINIIFEIMIIIHYIHSNNYFYRDIKPNNIIIDSNKTAILIDFDRLINVDHTDFTFKFNHDYIAPEISGGFVYSKEVDIYSFGLIIQNIFLNEANKFSISDENRKKLQLMCDCCLKKQAEYRPTISELIRYLYAQILIKITRYQKIEENLIQLLEYNFEIINLIDPVGFCNLGMIFGGGLYVCENEKKEEKYYLIASDQKDAISQLYLALIYIIKPDCKGKYFKYLELALKQNDPIIQYFIGAFYCAFNNNNNTNFEKGIYYLKRAANQNLIIANLQMGSLYINPKLNVFNVNTAIYYYKLAAENQNKKIKSKLFLDFNGKRIFSNIFFKINYDMITGDFISTVAQSQLGILYYNGIYVKKDIEKAIYYFSKIEKAKLLTFQNFIDENDYKDEYLGEFEIEQINVYIRNYNGTVINSLDCLGTIYLKGMRRQVDINRAIFYFTISAENKSLYGQYYLGEIYSNYIYNHININKAIKYFTLVLNHDHSVEYMKNDNFQCSFFMREELHVTNFDLRFQFCYKTYALFKLGEIYYSGIHTSKDINKAIYYFTLSANQNYFNAQYFLGLIFYEGKDVPKNNEKAIKYLTLAANHNHFEAQMLIGIIYYEGNIVKQNIPKAIQYLTFAANSENQKAQLYLGIIYYEGKYIQRDFIKAIHYFKKASCYYNQYAKNNLGIMYKNGQGVDINIMYSIEYFEEAIMQKNDRVACFNLAHIYFYENNYKNIDKAIKILTRPIKKEIPYYIELLSLIFIQKYDAVIFDEIEAEIRKFNLRSSNLIASKVCEFISKKNLNKSNFLNLYKILEDVELIYISDGNYATKKMFEDNHIKFQQKAINKNSKDIDENFYEGFEL